MRFVGTRFQVERKNSIQGKIAIPCQTLQNFRFVDNLLINAHANWLHSFPKQRYIFELGSRVAQPDRWISEQSSRIIARDSDSGGFYFWCMLQSWPLENALWNDAVSCFAMPTRVSVHRVSRQAAALSGVLVSRMQCNDCRQRAFALIALGWLHLILDKAWINRLCAPGALRWWHVPLFFLCDLQVVDLSMALPRSSPHNPSTSLYTNQTKCILIHLCIPLSTALKNLLCVASCLFLQFNGHAN